MKKYLPISQIPREIKDFYNNYQDRYEEIIVTYRDDPLFTVIFKKGSVHIEALTVGDVVRAVDPDTDNRSYTCTPNLVSFDVQNGVLNFVTRCAESRNAWEQRVQFTDSWDLVPEDLRAPGESWQTLVQKFPDVMDLDCRVHCTCPAFLYWGYLYIDTQLDVQLVDENRYPGVRNPDLNGIVCKHLAAVLRNYFR